ncbi:lytic polysaccharide monooxygenase [Streptomyces sodiiphilus]|uniref:lytic polysaccharide monooxygenase n=1 Tax=Streptomyces sodiiphilus TaxID=226217 RepID=UPI003CD06D22
MGHRSYPPRRCGGRRRRCCSRRRGPSGCYWLWRTAPTSSTPRFPGGPGRHLIYSVWQRSDSPEAFYTCSDVVFDGSAATPRSTDTTQDGQADSGPAEHSGHAEPGHSGHGNAR